MDIFMATLSVLSLCAALCFAYAFIRERRARELEKAIRQLAEARQNSLRASVLAYTGVIAKSLMEWELRFEREWLAALRFNIERYRVLMQNGDSEKLHYFRKQLESWLWVVNFHHPDKPALSLPESNWELLDAAEEMADRHQEYIDWQYFKLCFCESPWDDEFPSWLGDTDPLEAAKYRAILGLRRMSETLGVDFWGSIKTLNEFPQTFAKEAEK